MPRWQPKATPARMRRMTPGQLHLFEHGDHSWLDALAAQGYSAICERNGHLCAIRRFNFTIAIVVGMDPAGYQRRYCFEHEEDARQGLAAWDGKDHPGGAWIHRPAQPCPHPLSKGERGARQVGPSQWWRPSLEESSMRRRRGRFGAVSQAAERQHPPAPRTDRDESPSQRDQDFPLALPQHRTRVQALPWR
jgi:hypothetical protein